MPKRLSTPKIKVRVIPSEDFLPPGAFYAASTLVLAALSALIAGLGILGVIDYPAMPKLGSHFPLFCTTFGGGFAALFAVSSFVLTKRANRRLKDYHLQNLQLRKSCMITQEGETMRVLTTSFVKRQDLLPTLSKQQKMNCLLPGQWTFHIEEDQRQLIAKFEYENTLHFRKFCSVSLKLSPFHENNGSKNVMFDREGALFIMLDGKVTHFRGDIANNFLIQKMWIFCRKHFKHLMGSE